MLSVIAGLLVGLPCASLAQTTTGSVRGYVKDSSGAPLSDAVISAANAATGVQRATQSDPHGFYALLGLTPGHYAVQVRRIGFAPQTHQVDVPVGEVLSADFTLSSNPVQLAEIAVTAAAGIETRTSEVATNVTPQQIQQLPNSSGNFLNLAVLAPGVSVSPDLIGPNANQVPSNYFTAGGQGPGQVNVFVDGASMKDDITGGEGLVSGVAGQNSSRGNPFPLNAVQEYRVISQNFKAEYQRSSSAIITAVTKSGGTVWSGDASLRYQNQGMVALDSFQTAQHAANPAQFTRPGYSRYLLDLSAGGPLTSSKSLRFFGSYEGNYQNRDNTVFIQPPAALTAAYPALDSVNFTSYNGSFGAPFRSTLLFGKLSYTINPQQSVELSLNTRTEHDIRQFGTGAGGVYQNAYNFRDNTALGVLKHTYATTNGLNEATISYQRFQRNPTPNEPGLPTRIYNFPTSLALGSQNSSQNFVQKRLALRDDYTYTGFHTGGDHVLKAGINLDLLTYDIDKENNSNPTFFYDSAIVRNGDTLRFNYRVPDQMVWSPVVNPFLNTHNTQLGLYVQDDWNPTQQLTLNLGVRWDYESHMFNYDYVTPQDVIDTITKYNSQLQHPIDPGTYFTDGHQRKPFLGAFQPRLGFSYALDKDNKTTLFGAWGIFYDRSFFDMSVDETLKLTNPTYTVFFADPDSTPKPGEVAWNSSYLTTNASTLTPLVTGAQGSAKEVWLIANNVKPPKAYQYSLGERLMLGRWALTLTYQGVRGVDGLVLNWANFNLNPNGSCCVGTSPFHGFSNIIYSTNNVKTWYDAVTMQLSRPYARTGRIGWGAGLSVTYSTRSVEGVDQLDDEFAFPNTAAIPKHALNDEHWRVVANWVTDMPYLWGIQFSGLITLGTGPSYDIGSRFSLPPTPTNVYVPGGFTPVRSNFILAHAWAYRDVSIRLEKDFPSYRGNTVGVSLDVYNLFNYNNNGGYNVVNDRTNPAYGTGTPNGVLLTDPRRMQLGVNYHF